MSKNQKETKDNKDNNQEEEAPIVNLNLKINILSLVSTFQLQNGIRNKDYERYIQFCGKKINKLRKEFKLTQGKRKFNKIEINDKTSTDAKIITILILDCERKWALGALYNQRLTSIDAVVSDWRYKTKQKYFKAAKEAEKLVTICKARCDNETIKEAEAYYYLHEANYLIYIRKFKEALECFAKAKEIYNALANSRDSIEAFTYKDKVKYIVLQSRFCEYNLQSSKTDKENMFNQFEEDIEEELEREQEETNDSSTRNKNVSSENLEEEAFQPKLNITINNDSCEIRYLNTNIPIKNENIKNKFTKLIDFTMKIQKEADLIKKQNIFSDVFNLIDDAYKLVKQEKTEKAKDGESYNVIYSKLLNYCSYIKINFQIWKTMIYIDNYKIIFLNKKLISDFIDKDNVKLVVKPQEKIKLYDNLIQYFTQAKAYETEGLDDAMFSAIAFKERVANSFKIFYTAILYLSLKRYEEAHNLLHYFQQFWLETQRTYEINKFENIGLRDLNKFIKDGIEANEFSKFIIQKLFAKLTFDQESNLLNKMKDADEKNITEKTKTDKNAIKCHSWLISNLKGNKESINRENYEIFKPYTKINYDEYKEALNKQNYNNYSHLIQFPPNFQIVYPKPISFDLIHSCIQYPDLKHKTTAKDEKKGFFGKALGYMFGGKK